MLRVPTTPVLFTKANNTFAVNNTPSFGLFRRVKTFARKVDEYAGSLVKKGDGIKKVNATIVDDNEVIKNANDALAGKYNESGLVKENGMLAACNNMGRLHDKSVSRNREIIGFQKGRY